MKIIITESQYEKLTEEKLRKFLFSLWDQQKKRGEEPYLLEIIYDVLEIKKESREDYEVVRPIWYEYNGGYKNQLQKLKDEVEHQEYHIQGDDNLNMEIFVKEVYSYGEHERGGEVDITCILIGGTVDGYVYNSDTEEQESVPNMDIGDQLSELEYETDEFVEFLKDQTSKNLEEVLEKFGIPYYIEFYIK